MDWDTSIWLSCPIVFLWYPLKFHGPIPLNDIKPLFFPFFSIKWPKTTIFPNFFPNLCLQIWRNFDFEWPRPRRLSPGWSCPTTTGSRWPTPCGRPSGAAWSGNENLGISKRKHRKTMGENHGKSMVFFKGKSNFWEIYVFFSKTSFFFEIHLF